ncbi:hypothetical protein P692DRAFT_20828909 [Suillus brevipes Sb2]|nr:hypothetical protein P692DRAFT_20828909 [Suillus brevipes Sb2]
MIPASSQTSSSVFAGHVRWRSWICLHPVYILSIYDRLHWLAPCIRHHSLRQFNTLTISLFCYSAAAGGSDRVDKILLQVNDPHDLIPGV